MLGARVDAPSPTPVQIPALWNHFLIGICWLRRGVSQAVGLSLKAVRDKECLVELAKKSGEVRRRHLSMQMRCVSGLVPSGIRSIVGNGTGPRTRAWRTPSRSRYAVRIPAYSSQSRRKQQNANSSEHFRPLRVSRTPCRLPDTASRQPTACRRTPRAASSRAPPCTASPHARTAGPTL